MSLRSLLLFGRERWALPQGCVRRVIRGSDWDQQNVPISLSTWGLGGEEPEARVRILELQTAHGMLPVEVYGELTPRSIPDERIHPISASFFGWSPASALIVPEIGPPLLLLDPDRLRA